VERERLDKNVDAFNSFINKMKRIQFWIALSMVVTLLIIGLSLEVANYRLLIWGTGIVAVFLLLEGVYFIFNPYTFTNKFGSCLKDLLVLKSDHEKKLKLFGTILIGGIIFSIICTFIPSMKLSIPIGIPITLLGALQLVKSQVILFKCWILEDEFTHL
jgi:hypothetical protein